MNKARYILDMVRPLYEDTTPLNKSALDKLKHALDVLYRDAGVEFAFSTHFLQRVEHARNKPPINVGDLEKIFRETYKRYGKRLRDDPGPDGEAVIRDLQTDVNVPFVLKVNWYGDLTLLPKTAMRTRNFHVKPWQSKFTVGLAGKRR